MLTNCGGVTDMLRDTVTAPLVPVMVASPGAIAVTRPLALTLATLESVVAQVSVEVTSCALPSLNVAVAVSCWLVPAARLNVLGLMAMPCSVAAVTVTDCVMCTEPELTVRLADPVATPCSNPVALTVTTAGFELEKLAVFVMFCVVPSLNVPVTVSCSLWPAATARLVGGERN